MSVFLNGLSGRRPVGRIATTPLLRDNRSAVESYAVLITESELLGAFTAIPALHILPARPPYPADTSLATPAASPY